MEIDQTHLSRILAGVVADYLGKVPLEAECKIRRL